jgi:hypothetical protein
VSFFFDVPRVAQTHILGIPVTGKTLTYLLGLQVCSTSAATAISGLCGIVSTSQLDNLVKVNYSLASSGNKKLEYEASGSLLCCSEF